mmetsp:Transcript_4537/g.7382  ORF Transcript_4537/g.7382 Transcript_4537/m.7382 type:complete len:198 (+) Transcript_4537:151-744(+)|eukprot:CAMPEP_0179426430 /NCGR_PEP_ID=MMETSP0799-20121207/12732_1 /TAXON_ID=46947 /ORGANISM="Geminigera cryophila, Strain CCMP2564" /LENGTH=197 /DNA_ID=CAMNT_0021201177 /DNA_START=87 /DNA_END=680 /DNA_ORIENTATION=-
MTAATRGNAGHRSCLAADTSAAAMGVYLESDPLRGDGFGMRIGDGLGMKLAGGAGAAQRHAEQYGISVSEEVSAARSNSAYMKPGNIALATAAAAVLARGARRRNTANRIAHGAALGERISIHVMGQEAWDAYISTAPSAMGMAQRLISSHGMIRTAREGGWRLGGHSQRRFAGGWTMEDDITFTLLDHTECTELLR